MRVCAWRGVGHKVLSDAPTSKRGGVTREISHRSMPVCSWHFHRTADGNTACSHRAGQYRKTQYGINSKKYYAKSRMKQENQWPFNLVPEVPEFQNND